MLKISSLQNRYEQLKNRNPFPVIIVLAALFSYICIQNFFKWIPFTPGRTAFNLSTLQENIVSVISSLALFVIVVAGLARNVIKEFKIKKSDFLALVFGLYLLVQVLFREAKPMELARTLALGASLLSSLLIGKYFAYSTERLESFLTFLKRALLVSVGLGLAISIIRPISANWGTFSGNECIGTMLCRAEFFFFTINPLFLTVLLWRSVGASHRVRALQILGGFVLFGLALMTRTRQITLTILASGLMILGLFIRRQKKVLYGILALAALTAIAAGPSILAAFLQYTRIVAEPAALAVDPTVADWSTGRLALLKLLWSLFQQAPWFGWGGVEIRRLIDEAHLVARTEHGFVFYLAAYGLFGLFFVGYILLAFAKSIWVLILTLRGKVDVRSHLVTLALIAAPLFPFGFFGLFGSATNPTDWLALVIAALVLQSKIETVTSPELREQTVERV